MTDESTKPPIGSERTEVKIPGGSEPLSFESLDDLATWIEREEQFWGWLQKSNVSNHSEISSWIAPTFSAWNRTKKLIRTFKTNTDLREPQRQEQLDRISDQISLPYREQNMLLSTDPRSQYIDMLKDENMSEAAFALLTFADRSRVPIHSTGVIGMVRSFLFDKGLVDQGALAEKASLRLAAKEWNDHNLKAQREFEEQRTTLRIIGSELSELRDSEKQRFQETYDSTKLELKSIADTYDQKLALQQPVTYWQDRVSLHSWWACALAITWIVIAGLASLGVWEFVERYMLPQLTHDGQYVIPPAHIYYWQSFLLLGIVLMLLWPLRILSKLFLSNMHLRTEALERVTMANTFLALTRSSTAFPPDERKLLLEALFRPSSIGLVQEDGAPASFTHALSKFISGDRK